MLTFNRHFAELVNNNKSWPCSSRVLEVNRSCRALCPELISQSSKSKRVEKACDDCGCADDDDEQEYYDVENEYYGQ